MAHAVRPSEVVALRVRQLRQARGWSARVLAERCAELGAPDIDRIRIANLESGRRRAVSIDETFALAYALDVSPLHLALPLEVVPVEVTPGYFADAQVLRAWLRGLLPLPGQDVRTYRSQVPEEDWPEVAELDDEGGER